MRVVVGHANPDFDAYASMVAATLLYPGSKAVFLGSQSTAVRNFHNLHEGLLEFADLRSLDLDSVDSVVMVDTRDPSRVGELEDRVRDPAVELVVYDHHPAQDGDIARGEHHGGDVGATTTLLVSEIQNSGLTLTPLEATVMLLGIHEDTGSLTYPSTTAIDVQAVAFLMEQGGDLEVLNQFLARHLDAQQRKLLDSIRATLHTIEINGQAVAIGHATTDTYVDSAGVLTHYVVEEMGYRVAIAVIHMPDRMQVVARSRVPQVDVGAVMKHLGGGGHPQAASAGMREGDVDSVIADVIEALTREVRAPVVAAEVMSAPVHVLSTDDSMSRAGELMARWSIGGAPVMQADRVIGLVTRKDVDKALGHDLGHAPVTGFMHREVVSVAPDTDVLELERLLSTRGVGRLLVIDNERLVGIVTRKDVLRAEHGSFYFASRTAATRSADERRLLEALETLLPSELVGRLHALGRIARAEGMRAHVVGGFVRDMLLRTPNLDVDVVVEGDGVALAERAAGQLGASWKSHPRFGTAVLRFDDGTHIDIATSRAEFYVRPGALPSVARSTLAQDLMRRDFTINAMAAALDPSAFGSIADPFFGLGDLASGVVRILHPLSFIDDPTRILRAVRFESRYDFTMDPATYGQALKALEMGLLGEISGARLREELHDAIAEDHVHRLILRLDELGALAPLLPSTVTTADVTRRFAALGDVVGRFSVRWPGLRRSVTAVIMMCAGATLADCEHWLRHMRFGREYSSAAIPLVARYDAIVGALSDERPLRRSRHARLLSQLEPEAIAALWAAGDQTVRRRVDQFAGELSLVTSSVSGHDLIAMGYKPSARFTDILSRAIDDRLDGIAVGREAELAHLAEIATRVLGGPDPQQPGLPAE